MNEDSLTSFNEGLSPDGKIFNVDEAYQTGLITLGEKEEAVGRLITAHLKIS